MKQSTSQEASSHKYSVSVKEHGVSDTAMKPWADVDSKNDPSEDMINDPRDRKKTLSRWKEQIKELETRKKEFKKKLEAVQK